MSSASIALSVRTKSRSAICLRQRGNSWSVNSDFAVVDVCQETTANGDSAPESAISLPSPLETLLNCPIDRLEAVGRHALDWLNRQSHLNRKLFLRRLSRRLEELPSLNWNNLAGIELCSSAGVGLSNRLVADLLDKRPLSPEHAHLLAWISEPADGEQDLCTTLVRICSDLEAQSDPTIARHVTIGAFRLLSKISPTEVIGCVNESMAQYDAVTLTPLLDCILCAAGSIAPECELATLVPFLESLWSRLTSGSSDDLNRSGVLARTIELYGYLGESSDRLMERIHACPSPTQVLYLFVQRSPSFLSPIDRASFYSATATALRNNDQRMAFRKMVDIVFADDSLSTHEAFKAIVGT